MFLVVTPTAEEAAIIRRAVTDCSDAYLRYLRFSSIGQDQTIREFRADQIIEICGPGGRKLLEAYRSLDFTTLEEVVSAIIRELDFAYDFPVHSDPLAALK